MTTSLMRIVTFLIIAPHKYSYLRTYLLTYLLNATITSLGFCSTSTLPCSPSITSDLPNKICSDCCRGILTL